MNEKKAKPSRSEPLTLEEIEKMQADFDALPKLFDDVQPKLILEVASDPPAKGTK